MQTNLLPVPSSNENTIPEASDKKTSSPSSESTQSNIVTKKGMLSYYFMTVFLCVLSVLAISLTIFSESNKIFNPNKIIYYIAGDFLGVNMDDGNIYDLLFSGSFGQDNSSNKETEKPKLDNNTPPQNQPSNNGASNDYSEDDKDDIPDYNLKYPEGEIPEGEYAIVEGDFSCSNVEISNVTEYEISIPSLLESVDNESPYKFSINSDMTIDPLVLIIHTHGTEAYSAEGSISYSDNTNIPRSTDITKNVVAVGTEIARILNDNNIPTIHCTIMHDQDSYQKSYERSAETIESYLKKYPSIKYVFDIHRDSIIGENNVKYRPVTYLRGAATAQIMFVMGSAESTPEHTEWKSNLTLALKLTEQINNNNENLMRRISLRSSSYNQEYATGSLLVEIGSCGNTLSEATNAAVIFANEVKNLIQNGW